MLVLGFEHITMRLYVSQIRQDLTPSAPGTSLNHNRFGSSSSNLSLSRDTRRDGGADNS